MIHSSHSPGSLLLQSKYRMNCIFSPIALPTGQLCCFKPTASLRYLGLFYTRHAEDVRLRILRVKWRRKILHQVTSSLSSIISVRSGRYRFGIQSAQKYLQTLKRTFCSMGNLFSQERWIVDIPHTFSSRPSEVLPLFGNWITNRTVKNNITALPFSYVSFPAL
jgi:hypothetical protein